MAVETGQRRFARYGLPRLVAHAAPGRRDRITAHPLPDSQPFCPAYHSRTDTDRHDADYRRSPTTPASRVATGAANGRRTSVQQSDGAASLLAVRATCGFCDILLYLIKYLKTLIADHHRIRFAGRE